MDKIEKIVKQIRAAAKKKKKKAPPLDPSLTFEDIVNKAAKYRMNKPPR